VHPAFEEEREAGGEVLDQLLKTEPDPDAEAAKHDRELAELDARRGEGE